MSSSPPDPPVLDRLQVLRGLRLAIWEGSFATVFSFLTFNSVFLTGFALLLGASNLQIGLLASTSALSALSQLLCPYYAARARSRRWLVMVTAYPGRMLWLPILLLPFLPLGREARIWILLGLYGLSMGLMNFPSPAWTTWMADLVPEDQRGRYFGRRSVIMGLAGMAALLASGLYKDAVSRRDDPHSQAVGFAMVFSASLVVALAGWAAMAVQPEPRPRAEEPIAPLEMLRLPFQDASFRQLAGYWFCWVIAVTVPAPYFAVYMIRTLQLSYGEMSFLGVLMQIGGLMALPAWGYLSDKFGNKPILAICSGLVAILPWPWLLATRQNALWVLGLNNLIGGIAWYGLNLAQFNLVIAVTPRTSKQAYIAAVSAVNGLASFAGPLIGAGLLRLLQGYHASLLGLPLAAMEVLFVLSGLGRLAAVLFGVKRVQEAHSIPAGEVLHQIASADPVRTFLQLREARQMVDPERRAEAVQKLGSMGATLAVDELIPLLEDPSLSVRRAAARALGRIRDPKAVPALGEALASPVLGIAEPAARALGAIESVDAVPFLRLALHDNDGITRTAALRALGEIRSGEAVPDILAALQAGREQGSPEIVEGACEALAAIGSEGLTHPVRQAIQEALQDTEPRVRAAAARLLAELGSPEARQSLAEALDRETVEGNLGILADALSQIGTTVDILPLWSALRRTEQPVLRRQIAHAAAKLLAPEADAYALIAASEEMRRVYLQRFVGHHFGETSRRTLGKMLERGGIGMRPPDASRAHVQALLEEFERGDTRAVLDWSLESISPLELSPVARFIREMDRASMNHTGGSGSDLTVEEALLSVLAAAFLE